MGDPDCCGAASAFDSASSDPKDADAAIAAGANTFITKPVQPADAEGRDRQFAEAEAVGAGKTEDITSAMI